MESLFWKYFSLNALNDNFRKQLGSDEDKNSSDFDSKGDPQKNKGLF